VLGKKRIVLNEPPDNQDHSLQNKKMKKRKGERVGENELPRGDVRDTMNAGRRRVESLHDLEKQKLLKY